MKRFELQLFAADVVDNINKAALIGRSKRVAFMGIGESGTEKFVRMQGFTSMNEQKSPTEYGRRYIDEDTQRSDVTGYAAGMGFSFDRYSPYSVHQKLAEIVDGEKLGSDTHVTIVTVDLFGESETKTARKRTYSVVPDSVGDGTDALIYSGTFKAVSDAEVGTATSTDGWATATYKAPIAPPAK